MLSLKMQNVTLQKKIQIVKVVTIFISGNKFHIEKLEHRISILFKNIFLSKDYQS